MTFAPVFDAHMHVQPWHMLREDVRRMWQGPALHESVHDVTRSAAAFLRFLDQEGIETAVLVNYVSPDVMGFTDETNAWITDFVRGHEDRLVAMGSLHPAHQRDGRVEVERLAALGIRALKVHPPHQLVFPNAYLHGLEQQAAMYATAARLGLPIMVHTGTSVFPGARNRFADPMPVDDVACDFPQLRIVLAHGGRPLYMETCIFLVRRHANVWMDLSSVPPQKLLAYFPDLERLCDKILWGTDWPAPGVRSPRRNVEAFLQLPLGAAAQHKILRDNARAFFGHGPTGA